MLLASCSSVRPKNATDYDTGLIAPVETENFVLISKHTYDEPLLGVGLDYGNKAYPTDNIDLYVYPIDNINWEDIDNTLASEMQDIIAEIDRAVELGHYQTKSEEKVEPFVFSTNNKEFGGLKSSFQLTVEGGRIFDSNSYIFMDKDKYIKFRTSFDSKATVKWNGDSAVEEILPELVVPSESQYMQELREHRRQEMTKNMIYDLIQQAVEQEAE